MKTRKGVGLVDVENIITVKRGRIYVVRKQNRRNAIVDIVNKMKKTKIIDIEREVILRIELNEDGEVWLDFFTKEGLKTIKLRKESYALMLGELKNGVK